MDNIGPKLGAVPQKWRQCADWITKQNDEQPQRFSLQSKNQSDVQFILENNAIRRNFLSVRDEASLPVAVDDYDVRPLAVARHRLRIDKLRLECEWQSCCLVMYDYEEFEKHVNCHLSDIQSIQTEEKAIYVCLWDVCGHQSPDYEEMVRHINYHAYHAKLLAIGFNGRPTLKLLRCRKDSSKRNQLPMLNTDFHCMWVDCGLKFNSIQNFFNHSKFHVFYSENLRCSWAGCGAKFRRRSYLTMHFRVHSKEKLIACYHCGTHFANNRKLCDHLRRQNVPVDGGHICGVCSSAFASEYLLHEHARQHVSVYACTYCDMSAPTLASLTCHVRYRHLGDQPQMRPYKCQHCSYRAITIWDLRKHIPTHKELRVEDSDKDLSDEEDNRGGAKKKKNIKQYCCHMCPDGAQKLFLRGARLTAHLVKDHGIQRPFGHSRFRYQISEDGMFRLTTTRYESLEVSKQIMDGSSGPKEPITQLYEVKLERGADATEKTPIQFTIHLANPDDPDSGKEDADSPMPVVEKADIEITMCEADEFGNIISTKIVKPDVIYP